jgi:hypothetical protein
MKISTVIPIHAPTTPIPNPKAKNQAQKTHRSPAKRRSLFRESLARKDLRLSWMESQNHQKKEPQIVCSAAHFHGLFLDNLGAEEASALIDANSDAMHCAELSCG